MKTVEEVKEIEVKRAIDYFRGKNFREGQDEAIEAIESGFDRGYKYVILEGPTGSGKTTTLYASLHQLNTTERKLITVEDPVE